MKIRRGLVAFCMAVSAGALANGTDTGPGTPVVDFPFNDTGEILESGYTNAFNYSGSSSQFCGLGNEANNYAGNDVFYELTLLTTGSYSFTLTSDDPGNTDFAMFIVTDFGDNGSTEYCSQDSIDDVNPESIDDAQPRAITRYLVIDTYSAGEEYPKYGSFSINMTCSGLCETEVAIPTNSRVGLISLSVILLLLGGMLMHRRQRQL